MEGKTIAKGTGHYCIWTTVQVKNINYTETKISGITPVIHTVQATE